MNTASLVARVRGGEPAAKVIRSLAVADVRTLAAARLIELAGGAARVAVLDVERNAERTAQSPNDNMFKEENEYREQRKTERKEREREDREAFAPLAEWADQRSRELVKEHAAKMRMEWTAEILGAAFALPDGTLILWADATVDQHRARLDMFVNNITANTEGAARHHCAIRDITAASAGRLRDLIKVAA